MLKPLFLAAVCAATYTTTTLAQSAQPDAWSIRNSSGIAAVVGEEVITVNELRNQMDPIVAQIQRRATSQQEFQGMVDQLSQQVLQSLIDRKLMIQEFHRRELTIPQTFLENQFDDHITRHFNNDRAAFLESLRQQGKTVRQFRDELKEDLIVGHMRRQFRASLSEISPEKIEAYYRKHQDQFRQEEAVYLRQILLSPYADEDPALMSQNAQSIMDKLEAGADFTELARKHSQDSRAAEGGLMGWVNRSEIRKELEEAAFALKAGQYSQPIFLDTHVFILYVEDRRSAGVRDLAQVREQIEETLANDLVREAQREWLENLRKDAYVKVFI